MRRRVKCVWQGEGKKRAKEGRSGRGIRKQGLLFHLTWG